MSEDSKPYSSKAMTPLKNNQKALVGRLRATLQRPDTVLLIGSGVSVWSGLPNWERLISELAVYLDDLGRPSAAVRDAAKQNDFLLAASYGVHQLNKQQFARFVRTACRVGKAKPHEIHSLIANLGPSSFITTNYDKLLETSLISRKPEENFHIVTSRQPTEIPEIIKSTSKNFVFKYHGDVDDAEGVILSREQYANLHSAYQYVQKSLETILTTRPVVMLGFGLRDPDFLYIKDQIRTSFSGGFGEHYAIIADVDEAAKDYWRQIYSVEILDYETKLRSDGTRDHSALLDLLKSLQPTLSAGAPLSSDSENSDFLIRLGRYATKLRQNRPSEPLFPLTVQLLDKKTKFHRLKSLRSILSSSDSFVLLGAAGAGKTHSLKNFVSDCAEALIDECLTESSPPQYHVPITSNLALYGGDMISQLAGEFPVGVDIVKLLTSFRSTIVLDSINEMPEHFIEDGSFFKDLESFRSRFPACRLIIAGRSGGWIDKIDLPTYEILSIDSEFVIDSFRSRRNINLEGRNDLLSTLTTPLFFQICISSDISLDAASTPHDVHRELVLLHRKKFVSAYEEDIDFNKIFGSIAYSMLSDGVEYFTIDALSQSLQINVHGLSKDSVINFLVGENFIHPLTEHRLGFFHQSVTEYFASSELRKRYITDSSVLRECLKFRRWDYTIYLTISGLSDVESKAFFQEILRIDVAAAMRAVHHIKRNRASFVQEILKSLGKAFKNSDFNYQHTITWNAAQLPLELVHLPELDKLSNHRSSLGGFAAGALADLSPSRRREMISRLAQQKYGYNYASSLARKLADSASVGEIDYLIECIAGHEIIDSDVFSAASQICTNVPPENLLEICDRHLGEGGAVCLFLIDMLRDIHTPEGLKRAVSLARGNFGEAIFSIYCITRDLLFVGNIPPVSYDLMDALINSVSKPGEERKWALLALAGLQAASGSWRTEIVQRLGDSNEVARIALELRYVEGEERVTEVAQRILLHMDRWSDDELDIFFDDFHPWHKVSGPLMKALLETRRRPILNIVFNDFDSTEFSGRIFSLKPASWWLDWLLVLSTSDSGRDTICVHNVLRQLRDFETFRREVILRLREHVGLRQLLLNVFSPSIGVTTSDLDYDVVEGLIRNPSAKNYLGESVLGLLATDDLADSMILEAWRTCPPGKRKNSLRDALDVAGRRHNRRYI